MAKKTFTLVIAGCDGENLGLITIQFGDHMLNMGIPTMSKVITKEVEARIARWAQTCKVGDAIDQVSDGWYCVCTGEVAREEALRDAKKIIEFISKYDTVYANDHVTDDKTVVDLVDAWQDKIGGLDV
jgi:hypothetical protein